MQDNKMTFQVFSDLHLEMDRDFKPQSNTDVVVLAGDINVGTKGLDWARNNFSDQEIIYVAGNHEFYHHDYHKLLAELRKKATEKGIHFLENNQVIIGGIRILGCTFWTNYMATFNMNQANAMILAESSLADHQLIKLGEKYSETGRFTANFAYQLHCDSIKWLEQKLLNDNFDGKTLVVSHHGPSIACAHKKYGHNNLGSAFYSSLDYLVEAADVWVYGHTHSNIDTIIEGCRLIANQRGYPNEIIQGFNEHLILSL
jgi:predicted phosphodiesterase